MRSATGSAQVIEKLDRLEARLSEAERDIDAAHGGDADAAQRARRALLDVDATMAEADLARKWPELDAASRQAGDRARRRPSASTAPRPSARCCRTCSAAMDKARRDKDAPELERQMRLAQRLSSAAFNRTPEAWEWYFEDAASEVSQRARPAARAAARHARARPRSTRGDTDELRRVVKALWQLLPDDSEARKRGFDSGVR